MTKKFYTLQEMQKNRSMSVSDEERRYWQNAIDDYFLEGKRLYYHA